MAQHQIKKMRAIHHEIMVLDLQGWSGVDIAESIGMSASNVSLVMNSGLYKKKRQELQELREGDSAPAQRLFAEYFYDARETLAESLELKKECPTCDGEGLVPDEDSGRMKPCGTCKSAGFISPYSYRDRVDAAKAILDRHLGKPRQTTDTQLTMGWDEKELERMRQEALQFQPSPPTQLIESEKKENHDDHETERPLVQVCNGGEDECGDD